MATVITAAEGGVYLDVHVQPGARRPGVAGRHGDRLKVGVAAPAEGGQANAALVDAVSSLLGVRPSAVAVVAGAASRRKRLFVAGIDAAEARRRLGEAVSP